ncbi:hypothetical protein HAX54_037672 [Datura stramonium]|uniref:Uncharacterized protein n=1 Tax=Datura stramonium TaxID=4076 RepID=A0ABS8VJE5_DATST|nr:hypothetical protein [Datura stramonium]
MRLVERLSEGERLNICWKRSKEVKVRDRKSFEEREILEKGLCEFRERVRTEKADGSFWNNIFSDCRADLRRNTSKREPVYLRIRFEERENRWVMLEQCFRRLTSRSEQRI